MPGDEANILLVAAATADPRDNLAADRDWARGVLVTELRIGNSRVPHELARPRVQSDDVGVARGAEDLVFVDGDVSLNAFGARQGAARSPLGTILPYQVSRRGIKRLNDAVRVRQVDDTVVDERCRFLRPVSHIPRPRELKALDVVPLDLI